MGTEGDYTLREFSQHFRDAMLAARVRVLDGPAWAPAYFAANYESPQERLYKQARFERAMSFVESNLENLDQTGVGVFGGKTGGIHKNAAITLWACFSRMDERQLEAGLTWDEFKSAFDRIAPD